MNTPRTKPLVRFSGPPKKKGRSQSPNGHYTEGLHNDEMAALVGKIVTGLVPIEETMIAIMAILMGGIKSPARQVFRSLNSEEARVKIMQSLLERHPLNKDKGREFDDIIALFIEVKRKRNAYAHGLWHTHNDTGRVFISELSPDFFPAFLTQREVKKTELLEALRRMNELQRRSLPIIWPQSFGKDGKPLPSPQRQPLPHSEE
jgi:hypothetical protein